MTATATIAPTTATRRRPVMCGLSHTGAGRPRAGTPPHRRKSTRMDRGAALIATVATGALVAFQPPANALLGRVVGDLGAAVISVAISMVILTVLLLTVGDVGQLGALDHFKPEYVIG